MLGFKVTIVRYISDEPQPGIVECELMDAHGRTWRFIEKTAIVSEVDLNTYSPYPQSGVVAGEIVHRIHDKTGREIIRFDTERPWDVESIDGMNQFDVLPKSVVEFNWR